MHDIRYVDLFCGLGAFHQAFKKYLNTKCVFACDIDNNVRKIYSDNHGVCPHGDIHSIEPSNIPDHDILCAGFPCQPFSIAGNKQGFDDQVKGNLFFSILGIIDVKKPLCVVLENVKNIQSIDKGRTFRRIIDELEQREYVVSFKVLNAVEFGSPQQRERMFVVATKHPLKKIEFQTTTSLPVSKTIKDILTQDGTDSCFDYSQKYVLKSVQGGSSNLKKPRMIYSLEHKQSGKGGRQGERVYDINHPGITVCAGSGGPGAKTGLYKVGDDSIRRLNVVECLRMFGFPDDFKYSHIVDDGKMLFYLGNSIVVNVVDSIINRILRTFEDQCT